MNHQKLPLVELKEKVENQTSIEIWQQPEIWKETADKFFKESGYIRQFINKALAEVDLIVFTGAGTSSFIGHSLSGTYFRNFKKTCRSIPTTDIVTFPDHYFNLTQSYLVISFARSGNSPESVATLELADRQSKKCFHLIITCDASGALASYQSKNPTMVFTLPQGTNDKSLAMTGSYSSMLLSGLMVAMSSRKNDKELKDRIDLSIRLTNRALKKEIGIIKSIAQKDFKRAVFLGSGSLYGTATEAALKLQELTNGNVICKFDTFLGFRHGPKVVINETTLVVYFFNNDPYVHQYEMDLLHDMERGFQPSCQLGISEHAVNSNQLDYQINISNETEHLSNDFQALNFIVLAQLLGFYKSLQLGLNPDNPSLNGAISRVVQGVNIYPYTK